MTILTLEELATYCSTSGITQAMLNQANSIILSQIDDLEKAQKIDEHIKIYRGKLSHVRSLIPLVSIDSLKSYARTPFGISSEVIPVDSIAVDEYGYVTYYGAFGLSQMIFRTPPKELIVSYTYGYDVAPTELKMASAAMAQSIAKRGINGIQKITDMDMSFTWLDDSIVTSDIRAILKKYVGV